jgi:SWI/SNF-related matrix-associated actin-dependent regulator 1 of chromatin subfamily A
MANTVKAVDGKLEIRFDFDWNLHAVVKKLPGRRFCDDSTGKYWTAPMTEIALEQLAKAGFELAPNLKTTILKNNKKEENGNEAKRPAKLTREFEAKLKGLKRELFPFQKDGVASIEARNGRKILGDDPGLGKTIQAIAWLHLHPEKRPVIVLCPAHLKLNWKQEIEQTLPGKPRIQVLSGAKPYTITGEIIIINYDILSKWLETLQALKPQVLIFDEAHYIKSNSAQRTKATKKLAKGIPHVIAITGTLIVNRPAEAYNAVNTIDKNLFPNFWKFAHKYCGARHNGFGWDFSGATNKEELHRILVDSVMIRRRKADVLTDLPDKLYSYIPMEIDNDKEYSKAENNFIRYLMEVKGREAASKAQQAEHLVKIEGMKQLAVKGKMKQAIEWIKNFLEADGNGNKLVVFAVHKTAMEALVNEFKDIAVKVDGGMSAEARDHSVKEFQNNPKIKLFVGNIQAAGTGLTLTASSAVAFLELPWTSGDLLQAEDRCHRIGQKNSVNVYYLLAEGTIEEKIAQLLDEKRKVVEAVLDGKQVKETNLLTELIKKYSK